MSYTVRIMTSTDHRIAHLRELRKLNSDLQKLQDETATAVASVIAERAPVTDAAEVALLMLVGELRDEKTTWEAIAEGAGFVSPAAAKVWYQRARQKHGLFKPLVPEEPINDEGTLSTVEAADALGIPVPTFRDRVKRGDPETMKRVKPVASWHNGKPATRYRIVD